MPRRRGQFLGLLAIVGVLSAGDPDRPQVPAVGDVVDAVRASLARYHSISCRMVKAAWCPNPPPVGVRSRPADNTWVCVRRSSRGTRAYTETRYGEGRSQGVTKLAACLNGITKTCRHNGDGDLTGEVSRDGYDPDDLYDPLLMIKKSLSYLVGEPPVALTVTTGGMYRLETVTELKDRTMVTAWTVDPAHEYLPVEFALTEVVKAGSPPTRLGDIDYVWYSTVTNYGDIAMTAAGLSFPRKVTTVETLERPRQHGKRELLGWSETSIEDIVLNADMPDEMFQFRFPNGTRVEDKVANLRYVVSMDAEFSDDSIETLGVTPPGAPDRGVAPTPPVVAASSPPATSQEREPEGRLLRPDDLSVPAPRGDEALARAHDKFMAQCPAARRPVLSTCVSVCVLIALALAAIFVVTYLRARRHRRCGQAAPSSAGLPEGRHS
jgi:hypothetical protein